MMMSAKKIMVFLGKLLLGGFAFVMGSLVGSTAATLLGLQQPVMPADVDSGAAFRLLALESPLMMLALALIAPGLGGRLRPRALALSFFTWVVYTVNTAVESLAFTTTTLSGALFTIVSFLVPSLLCGLMVTLLFPSSKPSESLAAIVKRFFGRRAAGAWVWRIGMAALIFVPIYILFGSIVAPLTAEYFQQSLYGLRRPSQSEMLLVLLVRSALFLIASLPIVILWQRSSRELFLKLGLVLFILIGFLYMLGAYYMPLEIRVPHTLEILADSFVYAAMLVVLLASDRRRLGQTFESFVVSTYGSALKTDETLIHDVTYEIEPYTNHSSPD